MKAMGHADIQTTMIYMSLERSHIREQAERLNTISIPESAYAPSRDRSSARRAGSNGFFRKASGLSSSAALIVSSSS